MKLSNYTNEEALDLLADIIEPGAEIFADKEVAKDIAEGRSMEAVKKVIKNHKPSIIQILARLDGVEVENYKCNVFTLPVRLLEIMADKELIKAFQLQGQDME